MAVSTTRITFGSTNVQPDADISEASISADGRFITFTTAASNLVSDDANGFDDVYLYDRLDTTLERVSLTSTGTSPAFGGTFGAVSGNGRYVVFYTNSNLIPSDTNAAGDIYVKDRQTGTLELVSSDAAGDEASAFGLPPAISSDGRYVAFTSQSSTLVTGDTNNQIDVFVKDRQTGAVERVSTSSAGNQSMAALSEQVAISGDGRYVAFKSAATNLVANDTNNQADIFVKDRQTGITIRANTDSVGAQANGQSNSPSFSADGRYLAFRSDATNLLTIADTNGRGDVFVKDLTTGAIERVSTTSSDGQATGGNSNFPTLSADGRYVVFQSAATNLISGDSNGVLDVFVKDRQTGAITRISESSAGIQGNQVSEIYGAPANGLSQAGSVAVYTSFASNLVAGDTNAHYDLFVTTGFGPNTAPFVARNTGATVASGATQAIGRSALASFDAEDAASAIVYTLTSAPTGGTLSRGGTALTVGSTFTQADLDAGLSYVHSGSTGASDSFGFSVDDANADVSAAATGTFSITITGSSSPPPSPSPSPSPDPSPPPSTPGVITGSPAPELLQGSAAPETISGGEGDDTIYGFEGGDIIYANQDNDLSYGNQGTDTLYGGQGSDTCYGGQGADVVYGNLGNDVAYGNLGDDALYGGQGNDLLFGGQGNDTLAGGVGNDVLTGGLGADRYVFGPRNDADLILGFNEAEGDRLDFGGQTFIATDDGQGGTLFTLSGGGSVRVAGATFGSLSPAAII